MVLLVGFGFANIFFWNRPLLLAFGKAEYAFWVAFVGMIGKVALAFLLLPQSGYLMEAWLLAAYFIITVGSMVWKGLSYLYYESSRPGDVG